MPPGHFGVAAILYFVKIFFLNIVSNFFPESLKLMICLPSKKLLNAASHPYSWLRSQNH